MQLDIDIEEWPEAEWDALAERAAEAAGEGEPLLANPRLVVSLLFTSDAEVHTLNREWRGRDKPTNVLSFPMLERAELEGGGQGRHSRSPCHAPDRPRIAPSGRP